MIARRDLRSSSPMLAMSRSSMVIDPDDGSVSRNNADTNDDLPDRYTKHLLYVLTGRDR